MNTSLHIDSEIEDPTKLDTGRSSSNTSVSRILSSPYLHVLLLILLVALCFGRTLTSYFIADDFGEVNYVSRIFDGDLQLYLSNFTGNYMQIPGMNVWRPWLLTSLLIDFVLYKANSVGFFFTNLALFALDVLLVYGIARQLTRQWPTSRSAAASIFGAALFAASPLRCESVCWAVGRCDILCCFFYLVSYLLILKSKTTRPKLFMSLSILAFCLALGTKEMAIGLPALVAVTELLGINDGAVRYSLAQRFKAAARISAPFWVATLVYFIVRFACLGTLVGGYVAGFGASQESLMVQRWLDPDTLKRLFYPIIMGLVSSPTVYASVLNSCYIALFSLAVCRLITNQVSLRWLVFLFAWIATAAAPIFQLWGLGLNLEGARFYFFLSIPLSLLAPILLFRPAKYTPSMQPVQQTIEGRIFAAATAVLLVLLVVVAKLAYLSDSEWVHSGREVRQVSLSAQNLANSEPGKKIIVLGIPKERFGAHQILNGATFSTMLNPPFVKPGLADRFITFDPIMFGPPQFINATRFHAALEDRAVSGPFLWSQKQNQFDLVKLPSNLTDAMFVELPTPSLRGGWTAQTQNHAAVVSDGGVIAMSNVVVGDGIRLSNLSVDPMALDFLEFQYRATGVPEGAVFTVIATGERKQAEPAVASRPMVASKEWRTARIALSNYWRWFTQGQITDLQVQPSPCTRIEMRNFKLVSAKVLTPTIIVSPVKENGAGVIQTKSSDIAIRCDAREVSGAAAFELQISKLNYFFENFDQSNAAPVASTIRVPLQNQSLRLDPTQFKTPGYYQLRARCIDVSGKPIGEFSDNLTIKIIP